MPRAQRREQLLDLALELIVDRGYDALSMEAIATAAGVGKPVVYRSFPGAPALLGALLVREQRRTDRALARVIPASTEGREPREVLLTALEAFLDEVARAPLTWRLVLLPPEGAPKAVRAIVEDRRTRVVRQVAELVGWGIAQLDAPQGLDHELGARALVSAAQEQARIVLEGDASREAVLANARILLGALAWRR
jgi:AcrR family transcriptional regulator